MMLDAMRSSVSGSNRSMLIRGRSCLSQATFLSRCATRRVVKFGIRAAASTTRSTKHISTVYSTRSEPGSAPWVKILSISALETIGLALPMISSLIVRVALSSNPNFGWIFARLLCLQSLTAYARFFQSSELTAQGVQQVGHIPIPRVEYTDDSLDLVVENLTLQGRNLFPTLVEIDASNAVKFSPYNTTSDSGRHEFKLTLKQI